MQASLTIPDDQFANDILVRRHSRILRYTCSFLRDYSNRGDAL